MKFIKKQVLRCLLTKTITCSKKYLIMNFHKIRRIEMLTTFESLSEVYQSQRTILMVLTLGVIPLIIITLSKIYNPVTILIYLYFVWWILIFFGQAFITKNMARTFIAAILLFTMIFGIAIIIKLQTNIIEWLAGITAMSTYITIYTLGGITDNWKIPRLTNFSACILQFFILYAGLNIVNYFF